MINLRELDATVSEKVFGDVVFKNKKGGWSLGPPEYYDDAGSSTLFNPLPLFSTQIEDSWKIIEKIREAYPAFEFFLGQDYEGLWRCRITTPGGSGESSNQSSESIAICLAALDLMRK